jgi:hypothetical protein
MLKNKCLQATDRDSRLRLDGKGPVEESLVFGPLGWHEGLHIHIGQRRGASPARVGSGFPVKPICTVIELRKRPEREYQIHGA